MKKIDQRSLILGLPVFSKSRRELLKEVGGQSGRSRSTSYIFTPNPEQVVQAEELPALKLILQSGDWLLPDGAFLVYASRFLAWAGKGKRITERITGIDFAQDLLELAREKKWKVLLVGGYGYDQAELQGWKIVNLEEVPLDASPKKVATTLYWLPSYQQITRPSTGEERLVVEQIKALKPDLVFVAFGAPYQELWVDGHRQLLESVGAKLVMVVGGAFDVLTGRLPRAPRWMRDHGLEWLYRLYLEPWRFRRHLRFFKFVWIVIRAWV